MSAFFEGLVHSLNQSVSSNFYKPFSESFQEFTAAVYWDKERFLFIFLGFHCFFSFLAVLLRNKILYQFFLFFFLCILIFLSENLNSFCHLHWQKFSTQDYFDSSGIFIIVLYSIPLILICIGILINIILTSFQLAVVAKRLQLSKEKALAKDKNTTKSIKTE